MADSLYGFSLSSAPVVLLDTWFLKAPQTHPFLISDNYRASLAGQLRTNALMVRVAWPHGPWALSPYVALQ